MLEDAKISMLHSMLGDVDALTDIMLSDYLKAAKMEILAWRYGDPNAFSEVPPEYEMTQIHAVVSGFSQRGAEGQTWHAENGTMRTFHYDDMLHYIRANVVQKVSVPS